MTDHGALWALLPGQSRLHLFIVDSQNLARRACGGEPALIPTAPVVPYSMQVRFCRDCVRTLDRARRLATDPRQLTFPTPGG